MDVATILWLACWQEYHRPRLHYWLHQLTIRNVSSPDQSSPRKACLTPQTSWLWDSVWMDHSNLQLVTYESGKVLLHVQLPFCISKWDGPHMCKSSLEVYLQHHKRLKNQPFFSLRKRTVDASKTAEQALCWRTPLDRKQNRSACASKRLIFSKGSTSTCDTAANLALLLQGELAKVWS